MSSLATSSGSGASKEFQVGGKYRLVRRIGSGSFGDIYLGVNVTNGEVGPFLRSGNKQWPVQAVIGLWSEVCPWPVLVSSYAED